MASLHKRRKREGPGYTWYIRHYRFGKEFWKSCGTADKKLALEVLKKIELEDERFRQGLEAPKQIKHVALDEFTDRYLADRVDRFAPRTVQTDVAKLKIFAEFLKDSKTLISSVTTQDVEKFREYRLKKVQPGTVNISLSTLRAAFQWAEEHGYSERNPFAIRNLKIRMDKKIPRALTPTELEAFFKAVEPRHRALFSFVLITGARRSEIAKLEWKDVDFQAKTVTFRNTKGRKDRAVPMTLELAHLLNSISRESERVFTYNPSWFTHLFRIYRKRAGIGEHLTLHSLRHTSATELLRSGVSIYTVQKLLGHSSISVTERYLHAIPEDLREAAEVLSKKAQIAAGM